MTHCRANNIIFILLTWQENNYVHTAPDVLAGLCLQCHTCEESGCLGEQDHVRTMISIIQEQFLFTLFSLPHFLLIVLSDCSVAHYYLDNIVIYNILCFCVPLVYVKENNYNFGC